ncbi:MAG: NAD(P)H-dependent glycerol-3-phosphate dehydrogenase [Gammaproteobacteria bacterium]
MTATDGLAVLGAGSWGTALAIQLGREGSPTSLWGRQAADIEALSHSRINARYLPGIRLPDSVMVESDLRRIVRRHRDFLVCVPSHAFRQTLALLRPGLATDARVAWATKGFEHSTGRLPHEVAREELGEELPMAVLSGPTFAREVGAGLPTAMTIAATEPSFAVALAARLSGRKFRAYTTSDMIGVEVGGAVKNVLAIGAGMSDGLGFGANARIALITRGLAEMSSLGSALGGKSLTFMGLSGMGDLVLTCTDDQSRNRRFGLAIAAGEKPEDAARRIGQVVEGRFAAAAVRTVAQRLGVEMPICEQVYQVLEEGVPPLAAATALLARALGPE